jgi:hypothetical protein
LILVLDIETCKIVGNAKRIDLVIFACNNVTAKMEEIALTIFW